MAYRKLTGQISHRHPFHGYYHEPDMYDFDMASIDKLYKGVQGYQVTEPVAGFQAQATVPVAGFQAQATVPVAGCSSCSGYGQFDAQSIAATLMTGALIGLGTYAVAKLLLGKSTKTSQTWGLWGGGIIAAMSLVADMKKGA